MTNERERSLRAVLGDKFEALAEMGFVVVDAADLDRYQREKTEEAERARRIARAALDASESRGLLVDIVRGRDGTIRIIVCDPHGDEETMAQRVAAALGAVFDGPGRSTGEPPRRAGEPEAE